MSLVRVISLSLVAVAAIVGIAFGVAVLVSGETSLAQKLTEDAPANDELGADASAAIEFWEERLRENPQAVADRVELGRAYVRFARETGDVEAYGKAETVLRDAVELSPPNPRPQALLSTVLIAQHAFDEARDLAQPIAGDRRVPQALVALGDAELALGNLDEAEAAYDELAAREPGPVALSRQAAVREAQGEWEAALGLAADAARTATEAGLTGEARAWYDLQVAELSLEYGRFDAARRAYLASLAAYPGYPVALAGLGQLEASEGDDDEAIAFLEASLERAPDLEAHALLGDLYARRGDEERAAAQYAAAEQIGLLDAEGPGLYRHELAHFYADRGLQAEQAVELALTDLELRQNAEAYDLAGWAMYRAGRFDEAKELSDEALATGVRAPSVLYHAGLIALALDERERAQTLLEEALAVNPSFDLLQAPRARETLDELRDE